MELYEYKENNKSLVELKPGAEGRIENDGTGLLGASHGMSAVTPKADEITHC